MTFWCSSHVLHVLTLFYFIASLPATTALEIVSPAHLAKHVNSPLFGEKVGPQTIPPNLTGQIAYTTISKACKDASLPGNIFLGKIVIMDRTKFYESEIARLRRGLECVSRSGAFAVVRILRDAKFAGFPYHFDDGLQFHVEIPVVGVARHSLDAVKLALENTNETITMTITSDANEWEAMWNSRSFFALFKVVIPIINIFGFVIALSGIILHSSRSSEPKSQPPTKTTSVVGDDLDTQHSPPRRMSVASVANNLTFLAFQPVSTNYLKLLGCAIELTSCSFRLAYCFSSPLFSSSAVPLFAATMLLLIPSMFEVYSTLIAVNLFLRWGAFGAVQRRAQTFWYRVLGAIGLLGLVILIVISKYISAYAFVLPFFFVTIGFQVLVTSISSVAFIWQGSAFVLKVRRSSTRTGNNFPARKRAIERAVRWMQVFGACQILQVACAIAVAVAATYPFGLLWTLSLYIIFLSLGAVAQAFAFGPITIASGLLVMPKFISEWTTKKFPTSAAFWRESNASDP
eukprot:c4790_g1_i1.p1 GENE.c4790_g1_i1~~c4790_g1_i1.p1  ORF type:complete len:516 (+),score=61.68 c4790_g1_i1:133-1680(+)